MVIKTTTLMFQLLVSSDAEQRLLQWRGSATRGQAAAFMKRLTTKKVTFLLRFFQTEVRKYSFL